MDLREYIRKEFDQFFTTLGIEPLNAYTILYLIFFVWSIKNLKNWRNKKQLDKNWYILFWIFGLLLLYFWILKIKFGH